jgi:succinate dehydrogenase/fumarate reductase cytochrome b subunit
MENRSIFALHGITGMLIATVLLLSILAGLTVWGIQVQQGSAANYYQIENEKDIKMIDTNTIAHRVNVSKE